MPLHRPRRAGNVGGRSGVVDVEQCVIWWLRRYLVVRLRKRCAGVRARWWRLATVWFFMLGCVALSVYFHSAGADKCKTKLTGVLNTALDMAAAELCIEWGVGGSYIGAIYCNGCDMKRWSLVYR